jgi:hypothetical protein
MQRVYNQTDQKKQQTNKQIDVQSCLPTKQ